MIISGSWQGLDRDRRSRLLPTEKVVAILLATQRSRAELLAATEAALAPIQTAVQAGRLAGADKIGLRVGGCWAGTRWPSTSPSPLPTPR
jgi:hypothetical protein